MDANVCLFVWYEVFVRVCEVRECVQVPRGVSALCASPADSTLTLGFIEVCVCVCVCVCE